MRKIILLLIFFPALLHAQTGDFFLNHFHPTDDRIGNANYAIAQDSRGQLSLANKKGVLKFDGHHWYVVKTPSSALALFYHEESKNLFVGCRNSFGEVLFDSKGTEHYVPLSKNLPYFGDVSHIEVKGDWVYFLTENFLFEYSMSQKSITGQWSVQEYHFFSLLQHKGEVLVFTEGRSFMKVEGGQLTPHPTVLQGQEHVIFAVSANTEQTLIGTEEGGIYLLEKGRFSKIRLDDQNYLNEAHPLGAVVVNDTLAFISTLSGGALAVNWKTGKTVAYVNYQSGLPDNEIKAIGKDAEGGVWLAHDFGLTRVHGGLPFKVYSNYPGLQGHVLAAAEVNGQLYVGTSVGLFYLSRVGDYQEMKKIIKETQAVQEANNALNQSVATIVAQAEDVAEKAEAVATQKTSWLKRIFSKKKKKNKGDKDDKEEDEIVTTPDPNTDVFAADTARPTAVLSSPAMPKTPATPKPAVPTPVQSDIYRLQSAYWVFKPVSGINGKCAQLLSSGNELLVGANTGIYSVMGSQAKQLSEMPIRYLYKSRYAERLYASTYENTVLSFKKEGGSWKETSDFGHVRAYFSTILEDSQRRVWLCGSNQAYAVTLNADGSVASHQMINIENPYNDEIFMVEMQGKPYFLLSSGIYYYGGKDLLVKDSVLMGQIGFQPRFLHSQPNMVWMHNGHHWVHLSQPPLKSANLAYTRLLDHVAGISIGNNEGYIWVITRDNHLHKLHLQESIAVASTYEGFIKHVYGDNREALNLNNFEVAEDRSELRFYFAMPDYLDRDKVEYQHKLVGIDADWSAWTAEDELFYGSLPSGRYRLLVRARNSSGKVSELEPVIFTVQPPYWEQTWFYGLEILFFGSLLLFSFRLNRAKKSNKVLTKVLTFLTLIFIVEFLQVLVESQITIQKTPVTNFAIQAAIALLIYPIERGLSYLILERGKEKTARPEGEEA